MSEAINSNIPNQAPEVRQQGGSGSSESRKRRRTRERGGQPAVVLGSDWGSYSDNDVAQFDANFLALNTQALDAAAGVTEKSDLDPEAVREARAAMEREELENPSVRPRNMTEVKLGEISPPPPMDSKFRKHEFLTGDERRKKDSALEQELHLAVFNHLHAENLNAETARVVLDLANSREPITCVRAGLTEMQRKNIWEPIIRSWWGSLGDYQRGKFTAAARRFDTGAGREAERQVARNIGYGRLLKNIFNRTPERQADLYDALKNGREPFCPEGFPAESCVEWRDFLRTTWFASLTPEERLKMDALSDRQRDIPAERARIMAELAVKRAEIKKYFGLRGMWTRMTSSAVRMNRQGAEYPEERLKTEIAALEAQLRTMEVSTVIDQEHAAVEAKLHSAADQVGLHAVSADKLFHWVRSDKGGIAQSLEGLVLTGLNGARHVVPAVVERWMLESASSQAVNALPGDGKSVGATQTPEELSRAHRTVDEHGTRQIDWEAYLFALQKNITAEIAQVVVRAQQIKSAVEKEPLKSLLKAYREAASHLTSSERERDAQIESYLSQMTAQTDGALRERGVDPKTVQYLLPAQDQNWVRGLLEDQQVDKSAPSRPKAHAGESQTDATDLRLRETVVAGPDFNLSRTIRNMIKKFYPEKESPVTVREAHEFLRLGWVFEHGDSHRKAFYNKDGDEWVQIYAADHITAVQNSEAPFGFTLEINHKPAPQRDGYFLHRPDGVTEVYYERKQNGLVHVWEPDKTGKLHFTGYFEGKKFVPRLEREWKYVSAEGHSKTVNEFDDNIFFGADGSVFAQHAQGPHALSKLGTLPNSFEKEITLVRPDGSQVRINLNDSEHRYLMTPRSTVVEYFASVNETRELGKIQS